MYSFFNVSPTQQWADGRENNIHNEVKQGVVRQRIRRTGIQPRLELINMDTELSRCSAALPSSSSLDSTVISVGDVS